MRFRGKSIRRKIVGLLLVPLVSLTSIWAFATVVTGREAAHLLDAVMLIDKAGVPIEDTAQMLEQERRQTLIHLADPRRSDGPLLLHRRQQATDKAVAQLRASAEDSGVRNLIGSGLDNVLDGLDGLDTLRRKVEEGTVTRNYAYVAYNAIIDPCYDVELHFIDDPDLEKEGHAVIGLAHARELLAREDALLVSGIISDHMSPRDLRAFSDLIANRNLLYDINLPVLPAEDRAVFQTYWNGQDTLALRSAEERVIADGSRALDSVNVERWQAAVSTVLQDLDRMNDEARDRYEDRIRPAAFGIVVRAVVAGVLGFLAALVSLVVSVRVGRSLIHDLTQLRKDAQEVSGVRLPSVMRRLAAGEQVDVESEAPRLKYGEDEIGQVGKALNTLQREAVEAAVKQAELRNGVSEVFVNLARRSQVLVHRQLNLLDAMERRTEDTDELADLFRLDHLAARMRRHAEGLVILSGATPSRQWRKPVQLMDVVRAAVAEVEDYERIEVRRLPRLAVTGSAVADLTHLIAELLENATVYSPPHTTVQVLGERVANGFTLEIHDRGLGMTPDVILDTNLRLAETPEFELSDTDRLGLFVVSRLARRQGVRVSLQRSPYGGTTAVLLIPDALLIETAAGAPGSGKDGGEDTGEQESPGGRRAAMDQTPVRLAEVRRTRPVADGPVELEAPVATLDEDDEGGPSSQGGAGREAWRDHLRRPPEEQHQQARDTAGLEGTRPGGPAPLPRRRSPVLVSDHGRPVKARDHRGAGAERSETEKRPEPQDGPVGETMATTGAPAEPAAEATGVLGLPRRVRQASLAPQLKADPAQHGEQGTGLAEVAPERDAEQVRARMGALQRGWQRGRAHGGEATGPAGNTAPGNTSEGDSR